MAFINKLLGCAFAACLVMPAFANTEVNNTDAQAAAVASDVMNNNATNAQQQNPQAPVVAEDLQAAPLNINTASAEELTKLKGIGKKKAEAIISYREQNGPFKSVDDLAAVKGINKKIIERNRNQLSVG